IFEGTPSGVAFCGRERGSDTTPGICVYNVLDSFNGEAFFFGLRVTYCNNSGMSYWVAEGPCVGLAPVAATGLAMPPPYDTLWPGVTWSASYSNVDMNASNAVAFFDALSGPGIDGTNAMTAWTYGINGFRLLARQGDPSPALNPGETIYSMGFGGGA